MVGKERYDERGSITGVWGGAPVQGRRASGRGVGGKAL